MNPCECSVCIRDTEIAALKAKIERMVAAGDALAERFPDGKGIVIAWTAAKEDR